MVRLFQYCPHTPTATLRPNTNPGNQLPWEAPFYEELSLFALLHRTGNADTAPVIGVHGVPIDLTKLR